MSITVLSNEKPLTPPPEAQGTQNPPAEEVKSEASKGTTPSAPETEVVPEQKDPVAEDSETPETTEAKETKTEEPEDKKKKGGFQRRIDRLNAQKTQAQQELEYWKGLAVKNAGVTKEEAPKITAPTPTEGKPKPESFDTHVEYVEALTDWKTEQKLKERDDRVAKERVEQTQSKIAASYAERVKAFSVKTPDFQEVLADVEVPIPPTLQDIILTSDNGPELAYALAKNPAELERIAKLSPTACAREVGKFEARLNPPSAKVSENRKLTQAPAPINPVGTGGKGSAIRSVYDPNLSQADYEVLRAEQRAKRRMA